MRQCVGIFRHFSVLLWRYQLKTHPWQERTRETGLCTGWVINQERSKGPMVTQYTPQGNGGCVKEGRTPGNQRGKIKCCCCSFGQWFNRLYSQIPLVASHKLANEIDKTLHSALGSVERAKTMERQAKNTTPSLSKKTKVVKDELLS